MKVKLASIKGFFTSPQTNTTSIAPAQSSDPVPDPASTVSMLQPRSPYEARIAVLRQKVDSLEGDKPRGIEGVKHHAMRIASLVLPLLSFLAIGDLIGYMLSGQRAFTFADGTVAGVYILAYAVEGMAVFLTYALQKAVQRPKKKAGDYVWLVATVLVWGLMLAGTSILLYIFGVSVTHVDGQLAVTGLTVRSIASSLVCVGSAFLSYWTKGKTLEQELADLQHRHHAFTSLHAAESTLHQAEKQMSLQEKQDEAYIHSREQHEQLVLDMGAMSNQIIRNTAEKALHPEIVDAPKYRQRY
jgi:hypothetical protein